MRRALLLLFLFFLLSNLSGQGYNYANGTYHTNIATSVAVGDSGQWVIAGYQGDYLYPTVHPYLSLAGFPETIPDEILDFSVFLEDLSGELMRVSNIIFDRPAQAFYYIIAPGGCDFGLPPQFVALNALNGFPGYFELDVEYSDYQLSVVPGQGVLIYYQSDWSPEGILYFDLVNNALTNLLTLPYNTDDVSAEVAYWSADRFLLLQESGLSLYQFTENSAELLLTYEASFWQQMLVLSDSTVLLQSADGYEVLNQELEPLTTPALPTFQHLTKDSLYVYGYAEDSIYFYQHDFSPVATVATEQGAYEVQSIAANNGRVGLVGSAFLPEPLYPFYREGGDLFFQTYSPTRPDIPSTTDLAVESITIGSNAFSVPPEGGCMWGTINDIEVVVKNNGSEPVESVTLSYEEDSCFDVFCPVWISWSKDYYELNIPPGGSVNLTIDAMELGGLEQSNSLSLCLRAHAWEGTTETDLSDNRACTSIAITDTEAPQITPPLKVYPTLCQDELFVELPEELGRDQQLIIYNAFGQLVQELNMIASTDPVRVDVRLLPAGHYLLQLAGKTGQWARFIKS